MSFDDTQKKELAKPLNSAHVKPPAPGKYGDYIEGWKVIEEANRIFGFDGWTRETLYNTETNRELLTLKGKSGEYQQWRVGYLAKVRVTAGGVVREGTGFGSGMGKPEALGEAIESAAKESETDAMKRALMTFGYPFGLALYDKTQANVAEPTPEPPKRLSEEDSLDIYNEIDFALQQAGEGLGEIWKTHSKRIKTLHEPFEQALITRKDELKKALEQVKLMRTK